MVVRPKLLTPTLIEPALNNICLDQTTAGAANLTINGALASGGAVSLNDAWRLDLESTANLSGVNFTITGTDADGNAQTETIAGPNNNTVTTTKYFKTITQIAASGAVGTNISIGTTDEFVTKTYPLDLYGNEIGTQVAVNVTGTIDFTVEEIATNPYDLTITKNWLALTAFTTKTADTSSTLLYPAPAIRLKVNSFTYSGAAIEMAVAQS